MTKLTIEQTADFFKLHDHFSIVTHRRPDGDTLGSAAFLCRGLRALGKTAHILKNPQITKKYAHLHEGLTKDAPEDGDTVVCVDVASPQMLPDNFRDIPALLRIDHHSTATSFTPYELVESEAAACGEILYDLLSELNVTMDIPMANALYTAVSTDTGCFRYANTTAHSFAVAAACAAITPDIFTINQALFDTNTLARLQAQSYLIENALFLQNRQIVICTLPKAVEAQLGATEDDLENISGFPRSIEGVKIAATLRQEAEGTVKVSVRAVPGYDAAAICAKFGGGGHKGAAGGSMQMSLEEAVTVVRQAMLDLE